MTFKELKKIVSKMKYKPGFSLDIYQGSRNGVFDYIWGDYVLGMQPDGVITVAIAFTGEDAHKPGNQCQIRNMTKLQQSLVDRWNEYDAQKWIYDLILTLEKHEAGEWLTFDGKRPFDPHSPELREKERKEVKNLGIAV